MIILGIDGSLTATGWTRVAVMGGVAEALAESCVQTSPEAKRRRIYAADDDGRRIDEIAGALSHQMRVVDFVAVEAPAGSKSSKAAKALGLVYGAVRALACAHGKPLIVVQAADAKRAMTGDKAASKSLVQEHAAAWLGSISGNAVTREAIADARAVVRAALESPVLRGGAV